MTRCQIEFYDQRAPKLREGKLTIPRKLAARIYQHADGYPDGKNGILERLNQLFHRLSGKDTSLKKFPHPLEHYAKQGQTAFDHSKIYGPRMDDGEWAAAEFITMFRSPMGGNVYVSHQVHGDIAYRYLVDVTDPSGWKVWIIQEGKEPALYSVPIQPPKPTPKAEKTDAVLAGPESCTQ